MTTVRDSVCRLPPDDCSQLISQYLIDILSGLFLPFQVGIP